MSIEKNISLLDDNVRITISDLPPRASQPSEEELAQIFGGFAGSVNKFFREKIHHLIGSVLLYFAWMHMHSDT